MSLANNEQPLRRYNFSAERIDQTIYTAEVAVIASSEAEAYEKAKAEADEDNSDWIEEDIKEGDPELTLEFSVDLTEEEVQAYSKEQQDRSEDDRSGR